MIQLINSKDRKFSDFGWLKTYWLFSFSDYYDPQNIQFGALRVYNDDVVEPGMGFPTHPHREMEIITVPISGSITHADSMGNETIIKAGEVQRMSAGKGLTHSEYNYGTEPVHFHQIWILPDKLGLNPTYDQRSYDPGQWKNKLSVVASGRGVPDVVTFNTDASIYRCDLQSGLSIQHRVGDNRRIFVYIIDGSIAINGVNIAKGDQARIDEVDEIGITALTDARMTVIDVPSCKGFGYDRETLRGDRWR